MSEQRDELLEMAVGAFATYRLARLVADDLIADWPRFLVAFWAFDWILIGPDGQLDSLSKEDAWTMRNAPNLKRSARSQFKGLVGDLVTCQVCVGVWIGVPMWLLRKRLWSSMRIAAVLGGQSFISTRINA